MLPPGGVHSLTFNTRSAFNTPRSTERALRRPSVGYCTICGRFGAGETSPANGPRCVILRLAAFGELRPPDATMLLVGEDWLRCGDGEGEPRMRRVFAAMRRYRSAAAFGVRPPRLLAAGLGEASSATGSGDERVGTGESIRLALSRPLRSEAGAGDPTIVSAVWVTCRPPASATALAAGDAATAC